MADQADAGGGKEKSRGPEGPHFPPPFGPPFGPPYGPPFGAPYGPPFGPPPFYPPEAWSSAAYQPFIEAQRDALQWYRDQLQRYAADDGPGDRLREALNALMASWLEAAQSFREQREQALRVQSDLIARYLEVLDKLLDRPDDPRS
jgi:hypothetical protein